MTTLAHAVTTISQKTWSLSAPLADSTTHLQVDSEIVAVTNLTTRQSMFVAENPLQCRVKRGQAGTTAVTHSQGATVTELIDPNFAGPGAGGVSVTGSQGEGPFTATDALVPAAVDAGGGSVVLNAVVLSDTEPTTTYPGLLWLQTNINTNFAQLNCRNATDNDWINVTPIFYASIADSIQTIDSPDGASEWQLAQSGGASGWVTDTSISIRRYGPNVRFVIDGDGYHMQDLPTVDPAIAGVLWNSSGTLKVSAG